jgi:hypothetical protein
MVALGAVMATKGQETYNSYTSIVSCQNNENPFACLTNGGRVVGFGSTGNALISFPLSMSLTCPLVWPRSQPLQVPSLLLSLMRFQRLFVRKCIRLWPSHEFSSQRCSCDIVSLHATIAALAATGRVVVFGSAMTEGQLTSEQEQQLSSDVVHVNSSIFAFVAMKED